ncbi:MAG: hypothetical protein E6I85_11985 [Chloroflexi bacterium]|nr:MAG: hypothetical protein E6I85_11985 [Chloroflexota bacterium]
MLTQRLDSSPHGASRVGVGHVQSAERVGSGCRPKCRRRNAYGFCQQPVDARQHSRNRLSIIHRVGHHCVTTPATPRAVPPPAAHETGRPGVPRGLRPAPGRADTPRTDDPNPHPVAQSQRGSADTCGSRRADRRAGDDP